MSRSSSTSSSLPSLSLPHPSFRGGSCCSSSEGRWLLSTSSGLVPEGWHVASLRPCGRRGAPDTLGTGWQIQSEIPESGARPSWCPGSPSKLSGKFWTFSGSVWRYPAEGTLQNRQGHLDRLWAPLLDGPLRTSWWRRGWAGGVLLGTVSDRQARRIRLFFT